MLCVNVRIGGATCIFTSDFHATDAEVRASIEGVKHKVNLPLTIEDNVFFGAQSMILKGVTIGKNSIVEAGSVVTKSRYPKMKFGKGIRLGL
jgi:transferase hexapeptide repeat containing protein